MYFFFHLFLLLYKGLQCRSKLKVAHGEGRLRCNGFIIFRPQFQPSFTGSFVWRNTIRTAVKLASVKYEPIAGLLASGLSSFHTGPARVGPVDLQMVRLGAVGTGGTGTH